MPKGPTWPQAYIEFTGFLARAYFPETQKTLKPRTWCTVEASDESFFPNPLLQAERRSFY